MDGGSYDSKFVRHFFVGNTNKQQLNETETVRLLSLFLTRSFVKLQ